MHGALDRVHDAVRDRVVGRVLLRAQHAGVVRHLLSRRGCEEPKLHAWSTCAACFCPCTSLSHETPLGRSCYQTSELPTTSEFPTELPIRRGEELDVGCCG